VGSHSKVAVGTILQRFAYLAALLAVPISCSGMMVRVDGSAWMKVVVVTPDVLVCHLTVSGSESSQLIGLDRSTGKVRWRHAVGFETSAGTGDRGGAFYLANTNSLQKRDCTSGAILWQTNLLAVPEQETPPRKTVRDHLQNVKSFFLNEPSPATAVVSIRIAGRAPQFFECPAPIALENRVFLARTAMSGGGCVYMTHFHDWLIFDSAKGKLAASGSGPFVGAAGQAAFILDTDKLLAMVKEDGLVGAARAGISNSTVSLFSRVDHNHTRGDRVLVMGNGSRASATLLDDAGRQIASFPAGNYKSSTGWVLLDSGVLKYSRSWSSDIAPPQTTNDPRALLQLFDFKGRLTAHRELAMGQGNEWHLECVGVTKAGVPIFYTKPHLFTLRLPTLEPSFLGSQPLTPSSPGREFQDAFHADVNSETVFQIGGNATLYQMQKSSEARPIVIRAIDTRANKTLWTHDESVLIKKGVY
jgi:hypothetical protein